MFRPGVYTMYRPPGHPKMGRAEGGYWVNPVTVYLVQKKMTGVMAFISMEQAMQQRGSGLVRLIESIYPLC